MRLGNYRGADRLGVVGRGGGGVETHGRRRDVGDGSGRGRLQGHQRGHGSPDWFY